jgi:tripartite-type tricarboxylate transporter receptor subunit TctC
VTLWLLAAANIRATYVPYRSTGMAMLDLAGGRIDATLANVLSAGPQVKLGKLRALGISTAQRSRILPDLPTIAEQGAPGYNANFDSNCDGTVGSADFSEFKTNFQKAPGPSGFPSSQRTGGCAGPNP